MDTSQVKEVLKKLSIIKDYSALFVSVVIALVALLLLIPTQLMSSKLREKMEKQSVSMAKKIESLSRDAVPADQWKVEQEYQTSYEKDANEIEKLSIQTNQRELLSYKIFPDPIDTSSLLFDDYGKRFQNGLEKLLVKINARECPSDSELSANLKDVRASQFRGRGRSISGLNNADEVRKNFLCLQRAKSASVYGNPADIAGYNFWSGFKYTSLEGAVRDCWYWQVGYWVAEDVIDTIGAMNKVSQNVLTSPVKRLLFLQFDFSNQKKRRRTSRRSSGTARKTPVIGAPQYILSESDGLTEFYTGRICDEEFDVIHFNISVIIDSKSVLPFMQELCSSKEHKFKGYKGDQPEQTFVHNQITILESKIRSVDLEESDHQLYRYGDSPVMKLDLVCEYLFNKKGYEPIMPESVKSDISGETEEDY